MKRAVVITSLFVLCFVLSGAEAHAQGQFLLSFNKVIESQQIATSCVNITCDPNQTVFLYTLQMDAALNAVVDCDETSGLFPDGSRFQAYIRKVLRLDAFPGPAGAPLGYILYGGFRIVGPAGNALMVGQISGTEGFETHIGCAGPECDAFPHMEGHLKGWGVDGGPLAGYRLEASYSGEQEASLDPDTCQWYYIKMQTDGILFKTCL